MIWEAFGEFDYFKVGLNGLKLKDFNQKVLYKIECVDKNILICGFG